MDIERPRAKPHQESTDPKENSDGRPLRGERRAVPLATRALPDELAQYMRQFYGVFRRLETFETACSYVVGLFSNLSRKNGETMAEAIEGISNIEAVHRFMALSRWSARDLDRLRVEHALRQHSVDTEEAALIVDEVSQLKKGNASVGVKRQYLGSEGKTANGQVTVTTHWWDGHADWPVTAQLYLPQEWADDKERRAKAGVPEEITFKTKPQIAVDLIQRALDWRIPVRWVLMDAGYDDLETLAAVKRLGLAFCVGINRAFMVRVPDELARWVPPPTPKRGRPRKHVDPRALPPVCRVDQVLDAIPETLWRTVTYRHGTAGPLTKQFVALRAQAATTQVQGPDLWVLFERPCPGDHGETKFYAISPPQDRAMTLEEMAQVAHRRYLIERNSYENGKGEVGLRDYQGRSWRGLHHHFALVMLALTWLNLQRQPLPPKRGQDQAPAPQPPTVQPLPESASLHMADRACRFDVGPLSGRPLPIPRQHLESVQEVRRRLVAWFALTVQRALTHLGALLQPPRFVALC